MKIIQERKLDFNDVLLVPSVTDISSRSEVNKVVSYQTCHSKQWITGIPVISANMSSVSTFTMATALADQNMFCALHKHYTLAQLVHFFKTEPKRVTGQTFYTLGINDFEKFDSFCQEMNGAPRLICLDVANGYMTKFGKFVSMIRNYAPYSVIMAGNVVTADGCYHLIDAGADIIKIGIGSSAVCRTRTVAGVGVPQFSAILDCYKAIKECNALLCSDGGCTTYADFGKAFCAGADFVMSGTMFAGHDECEGQVVDGKMLFYGMSSETAMNKHHGGMASHRASEGITTFVDYKGQVKNTVSGILGGINSTGSYINARDLVDFHDKATFITVNRTYNNIFGA
jgi:GMP reductase